MKTNHGFKKLNKKEKTCVYRAMELIEHRGYYRSCSSIVVYACNYAFSDNLVLAYRFLFARIPHGDWLTYDKLAEGLTLEELQQWRLTMLAWFAEVGRLEE